MMTKSLRLMHKRQSANGLMRFSSAWPGARTGVVKPTRLFALDERSQCNCIPWQTGSPQPESGLAQ
jgi:hypothetical protein